MIFITTNRSPEEVLVMDRLKPQNCSVITTVTRVGIEQELKKKKKIRDYCPSHQQPYTEDTRIAYW